MRAPEATFKPLGFREVVLTEPQADGTVMLSRYLALFPAFEAVGGGRVAEAVRMLSLPAPGAPPVWALPQTREAVKWALWQLEGPLQDRLPQLVVAAAGGWTQLDLLSRRSLGYRLTVGDVERMSPREWCVLLRRAAIGGKFGGDERWEHIYWTLGLGAGPFRALPVVDHLLDQLQCVREDGDGCLYA